MLCRTLHILGTHTAVCALSLFVSGCPGSDQTPDPSSDISADASADGASDGGTEDTSTDSPGGDAPVGDAPVGDAPVGDAPVGDAPVGDIPVGDTPPPEGCAPLTPATSGTCTLVAGDPDNMLLEGDLLLPNGIQSAGQVLIADGVITCVGCDCSSQAAAATATRITCAEGLISPGLINAHDHISWAQDSPKDPGDIRYDHRHEWRAGLNGKPEINTYQNSHALGDAWGEMRQVLGGTTSLFGSGGEGGFLRNLDRGNLLEGLTHADGDYSTFPLGDSNATLYSSGCGGYSPDDPVQAAQEVAYVPHISEGIIDAARNEFICVSGDSSIADSVDFTNDNAAFIHGIGVTTTDIGLMAAEGTALIWSPRSNTALYGVTANVPVYQRLGALVALGTDWTPSGSIHVLRELACAQSWNTYWDTPFSDADLVAMVTHNAAEALGFSDVLGSLTPGKVADIAIWNGASNTGYRAILDAESADVVMVMRGGLPLYGDAELLEATASDGDCETLDVCGAAKRICTQREIGTTIPALEPELGQFNYDLVFCGAPSDEPSCHPFRPDEFDGVATATDSDGDGINDDIDNCPTVFNPIRPMDDGSQNDVDGDGDGDECDPCPFDPDTTACSSVDPLDIDGDGVPIPTDNCPSVQNPNQEDNDGDGMGDACDPCPGFSNPGGGACPGTIYDVKTGVIGVGSGVLLQSVLVAAAGDNFFTVQMDPNDVATYQGAEHSGVYVYSPDPAAGVPSVGDRVDVSGSVNDFFGQTQLVAADWSLVAAGAGAPAPVVVASAELITGTGSDAAAYESLLVTVQDVTVTDVAPAGQPNETVSGEFEVDAGLPVDDYLYLMDPFPALDQQIPAITGFVRFSWNRNKLVPRSEDDLDLGAPYLLSFGPAAVVYDQQAGVPTIPALEVVINTSPATPLFIPITSSDAGLTVDGGGVTIATGTHKATVYVTTTAPASAVTLSATLDGITLDATVDVLDLSTAPGVASIDPADTGAPINTDVALTVTLDTPAPPGGQDVAIATSGVAGTAPATLTIAAGDTSADVAVTTGAELGQLVVTASIGASSQQATIEVSDVQLYGLLLVEVFYDAQSTEDNQHEWVKLYNGTGAQVDLSGYAIGYGGTDYTYGTLQLQGTVAAGECFVVGGPLSDASSFNATFDQAADFNPDIQNSGTTADGVALFDVTANQINGATVPIDAVVYGDANTNGLLGPDGNPVPAPHVVDPGSQKSIVRTAVDTWGVNDTPDSLGCITIQ